MKLTSEQLASLQAMHPAAKVLSEGAGDFVFLPQLPMLVDGHRRELDALLCPWNHGGYNTRLFLSEAVAERQDIGGKAANWSAHNILGRTWYTWSWQGVPGSLPLPQILLAHVKALR